MNRRTLLSVFTVVSALVFLPGLQAQTFHVLHNFTYGQDGANPSAGVTLDSGGNLYVTTSFGGDHTNCFGGCGTVVKLAHKNGAWVVSNLYSFRGSTDGAFPAARVTIGPDGALYGTTTYGGAGDSGTIFALRPPLTICHAISCPWTKTLIHRFEGAPDGFNPDSEVVFDRVGNFYGTTFGGGSGYGTVYEVTRSGGNWTESVIHSFTPQDGLQPSAAVTIDTSGNLYGTTQGGGDQNLGTVFKLSPSGSGWTETVLTNLSGGDNGADPVAGVVFDSSGNLFGATAATANAVVFELMPQGGNWTFNPLYVFNGPWGSFSAGPRQSLTIAADGSLYGTAYGYGAFGFGSVFKLTRSGGTWIYSDLYDFTGGSDGGNPNSQVTIDGNGNLYGTTYTGGPYNGGGVWEITPN